MPGTADREPSPPQGSAEQELQGSEAHAEEAPSPPFEPLFALLTNTTTNATVHPQIHYLFSDDDPSILTAPANPDPSHRTLIVDLAPAPPANPIRWSVQWASSLSQDFAVTASGISLQQNETDDGGLMLKVEGVEREPVDVRGDSLPSSGSGALGREDVEGLAEEFKRRMGVLKKVVAEGERRRDVLDREHGGESAVVDGNESMEKETAEKEQEQTKDKGKEKAEEGSQPKSL